MATRQRHPGRVRSATVSYAARVREGDSYGLLLALILVGYVVIAVLERSLWERFAISVVMGGDLPAHPPHVARAAGAGSGSASSLVVFVILSTLVQALVGRHGNDGSTFIVFLLVLAAPIVILNRILRHETIGTETILGAVCVYVLLGIAFAGIFAAVDDFDHGSFFAQSNRPATNVEFLYFSFITMTTVGYGDLSPATDPGRVIVTFEALLGQVFLVTLVARLVSMYGVQRPGSIGDPARAVDRRSAAQSIGGPSPPPDGESPLPTSARRAARAAGCR